MTGPVAGSPLDDADRAVLEHWWRTFAASGRLPADLTLVQGRLVRSVHRGTLPSGPVHVKAMTFPRAKDRLRYLLRRLPAAHEAAMLHATAAAGIPCPEVVAVRTARRCGLPFRSLLVLRTLPVQDEAEMRPAESLAAEAAVAARLLEAGIVHQDLHSGNFVRLQDGELAVLDMQSAHRWRPTAGRRVRLATRLLQDRAELTIGPATAALQAGALLLDPVDAAQAFAAAATARRRFTRGRVERCFAESTEFTRHVTRLGIVHRTRDELPPGQWVHGPRSWRRAWLGQRALQVLDGRSSVFPAFLRKWWWLGGGAALYVPRACRDDRIDAEVTVATSGYDRYLALARAEPQSRPAEAHGDQRS